jgi:8-oxo-dGTP pyrophosphatase MutT (NUDIX family)
VSSGDGAGPAHEFPVEASERLYAGRVMALRSDRVVMPGGRVATREIVEHPGAVAVAALDADDRLMMIHQYRHAVRRRLWELPAGLLDVAGEDPLAAARRELVEEAGLAAEHWSVLLDIVPSPGFSDESIRVYLARGVSEVGRPAGGDVETRRPTWPCAGCRCPSPSAWCWPARSSTRRRWPRARRARPGGDAAGGRRSTRRGRTGPRVSPRATVPSLGSGACASDCSSPRAGGTTSSGSTPRTSGA